MIGGRKVILLVEDTVSDVELTRRAMEKKAITAELVTVQDGREAMDYLFCQGAYLQRHPDELPDLVLLDLHLPKVDGLQLLQHLRANEKTRLLPVVVLTTSMEDNDLQQSYLYGANSYVQKPFDFLRFAHLIAEVGYYWLELNQPPPYK